MKRMPYRLGLPAWAFPGWRGTYFPSNRSMLRSYADVFNTVEGNTTFYSVPEAKTVDAWCTALAGCDLELCLKLPRTVTHERDMSAADLRRFLTAVEPLADHLGPFFVQFPATVGARDLDAVDGLLERLPSAQRAVVEVRHPELFAHPELLQPLLDRHRAGRVVLDSRPLFEGDRSHPEVLAALHAKPDLPVLPEVHNGLSFARLILHPDLPSNAAYIDEWAARSAASIRAGDDTYVMIHCPNNQHCPKLAETFHRSLRGQPGMQDLAPLPPWPVPQQGSLL